MSLITISWTAPVGPAPDGYNIYRGTARGNESPTPINGTLVLTTSYTDTTVLPGLVYVYEVTAVKNGVESPDSIEVVAPPVPFPAVPTPPALTGLASFAVLAGTTVTNTGTTTINGDVGVAPGTAITGFTAPTAIRGVFHADDYVAIAGETALAAAYAAGQALPGAVTILGDIGGTTVLPGLYKNASSLGITGPLVLDAQGNPNATWIFQIGSTLTTAASNSDIVLMGGAQAQNVYFFVGSSATLGTNTAFSGNILANTSITAGAGALIQGRLLAINGAVTLDANEIISFPAFPASPPNIPPPAPGAPTSVIITAES
jgi:hypothetical protein